MNSRVDFLRSLPYFADLGDEDLERIESCIIERSLAKGEVLFVEGGRCPGLHVVKSGLVRIFKTSPEGKEQVLLIARPADSFNDVPVFDGGPNPASAQALEATTIYIIPTQDLHSLVSERPAIAASVIKVFAARLRHLTLLVEDLSFRHVTSRLAKILLQFAEDRDSGVPLRQLTQQQMAAMVGTAREMIGRSLKALEEEGAIKIEGRRILVLNPEVLRDML